MTGRSTPSHERAAAFLIRGGVRLVGTYPLSGAKNAIVPLMVAALLALDPVTLRNVPHILDVEVSRTLLRQLGAEVDSEAGALPTLTIAARRARPGPIDHRLVGQMRASVLLLGAVLAALIRGVRRLQGAAVTGSDVRAVGALVIAALGAEGRLEHLHRGYDSMAEKLATCGAQIRSVAGR